MATRTAQWHADGTSDRTQTGLLHVTRPGSTHDCMQMAQEDGTIHSMAYGLFAGHTTALNQVRAGGFFAMYPVPTTMEMAVQLPSSVCAF